MDIKTSSKPQFSTIYAHAYRIIRDYYRLKGRDMILIDEGSSGKYDILRKIYFQINHKNVGEETLDKIISKISYFKNSLEIPTDKSAKIINFTKFIMPTKNIKMKII